MSFLPFLKLKMPRKIPLGWIIMMIGFIMGRDRIRAPEEMSKAFRNSPRQQLLAFLHPGHWIGGCFKISDPSLAVHDHRSGPLQ